MRVRTWLLATASITALVATSLPAAAATATPVIHTSANEGAAAEGGGYIAWEAAPAAHPLFDFNVFARKGTGQKFKVNVAGTNAFMGGLDGTTLIYQRIKNGQSDLELFDLKTKNRPAVPNTVNTSAFEYHPSISGNWILFGRFVNATVARSMVLYNLSTNETRVLDTITGRKPYLDTGQVNGTWVTWYHCSSGKCNVWRYNITTKKKTKVPNPSATSQYAPSVSSHGTVFFAQSGTSCGSSVRILRFGLSGPPSAVVSLPNGVDVNQTFAAAHAGKADVLFARITCPNKGDIYRVVVG